MLREKAIHTIILYSHKQEAWKGINYYGCGSETLLFIYQSLKDYYLSIGTNIDLVWFPMQHSDAIKSTSLERPFLS